MRKDGLVQFKIDLMVIAKLGNDMEREKKDLLTSISEYYFFMSNIICEVAID